MKKNITKEPKRRKISAGKYTFSPIAKLRDYWLKRGFELIDITPHCKTGITSSGWCNNINEPDESIYSIIITYRDEIIGVACSNKTYVIDDEKYLLFEEKDYMGNDFIIFRKVKIQ